MAQHAHAPKVGWGRTAGYGAEAGIALALVYALAFIGYAAVRSTLTILATPHPSGTLIATWTALAVPAFVLAAIFGILAALLGALTALVLRALVSRVNPTHAPRRAIGIGIAVCLSVSLALLLLLYHGLGVRWTPATAATLTFWLLVPQGWWRTLAIGGAGMSLLMLLFYLHPFYGIGIGASAAILLALLWARWPTPTIVGA